MPRLQLTLLGGFELRVDAGPALDVPIRKAQALLAYLALRPGEPVRRDRLVAMFWGDSAEQSIFLYPQWLTWLGEAQLCLGHPDAARAAATRALELARARRGRGHEAWALRLLAEVGTGAGVTRSGSRSGATPRRSP